MAMHESRVLPLATMFLLVAGSARTANAPTKLHVEPREVAIGMLFRGAQVHVEAAVPAGLQVAVACVGEEATVDLKVKGKIGGLLWLNVGDATFTSVPSVYLLSTSADLGECAAHETPGGVPLSYAALESRSGILPETLPKHLLFQDYLKLKQSEGLYAVSLGSVSLEAGDGGVSRLSATLVLPAKIPPGNYRILVLGCRDGQGEFLGSSVVTVSAVGLVRFVSDMAHRQGLLYGALAVLVAIAAGLTVGVLFGLGSKGGH
jgi:hypothetical protein